ncbi:MAG: cold shock domain-containing protein [Candidatus Zixiibacteriota bacterium]|nr:MAG: cold shock domain-containing protein [candidate division Zixibacteria bacterium]
MDKGRIKTIERSKGYGFIETDEGHKIFFHQRWLRKVKFKDLEEGDEVVFSVNMGTRGPRAYNLNLADNEELETVTAGRRGDELFKD